MEEKREISGLLSGGQRGTTGTLNRQHPLSGHGAFPTPVTPPGMRPRPSYTCAGAPRKDGHCRSTGDSRKLVTIQTPLSGACRDEGGTSRQGTLQKVEEGAGLRCTDTNKSQK